MMLHTQRVEFVVLGRMLLKWKSTIMSLVSRFITQNESPGYMLIFHDTGFNREIICALICRRIITIF